MPGAFEDDDKQSEIVSKKQVGVKLSNQGSILSSLPQKPSIETLKEKATEVNNTLNSYNVRAADLSSKFRKVLEDKTLFENKSPFSIDAEKELRDNLIKLARDINADEYAEEDGQGSVGVLALLLFSILTQRDRINLLEYRLLRAEQKERELEKAIAALTKAKTDPQ